jgi:uncharacterized membrane protein YeiB
MNHFTKAFLNIGKIIAIIWILYTAYFLVFLHTEDGVVPRWFAQSWGILMFVLLFGGGVALLMKRFKNPK